MMPYYGYPFQTPGDYPYSMPEYPQQFDDMSIQTTPFYQPSDIHHMTDIQGTWDMDFAPGTFAANARAPILSDNPATTTIVLFKELTGYPNYGNPSGNADILYTGDRGAWTFNLPPFLFVPGNFRAQIVIRAVLDDHQDVPVTRYSATITVNGNTVHTGRLPLAHGAPVGGRFNNWRLLTFNVPNLRRNNRVVIVNTSNTGPNDWIAFDWMELRLIPRQG